MQWLRRRLADERGASLMELIVAMGLLGLVGTVIMSSLSTSTRAGAQVDDQLRGLADLQVVTERLSRDLRAARGVDPGATASQLTIWIDTDSDYRRENSEIVTWRIRDSGNPGQFDVERVHSSTVQIVGASLVSEIAFTYRLRGVTTLSPQLADSVRVDMEYDAVVGAYSRSNRVTFDVRLRNVQ